MKSPEEYFSECDFSGASGSSAGFTPAEQAFIDKYMGADAGNILASLENTGASTPAGGTQPTVVEVPLQEIVAEPLAVQPQTAPATAAPAAVAPEAAPQKTAVPEAAPVTKAATTPVAATPAKAAQQPAHEDSNNLTTWQEPGQEDNLYQSLRETPDLLMVGFYIGTQEFVVPVAAVQEVIRTQPIAKLPAAPAMVAGVINLRGRVTPLIRLRDVLEVASPRKAPDNFIIVCRRLGLQVGLMVESIHTMYRIPQEDIDWNIEAHLGVTTDQIAGVVKLNDQIVSILYIDKIVTSIL